MNKEDLKKRRQGYYRAWVEEIHKLGFRMKTNWVKNGRVYSTREVMAERDLERAKKLLVKHRVKADKKRAK